MTTRIEVGYQPGFADPRGAAVLQSIRSLLGVAAASVRTIDVYTLDFDLSAEEADRIRRCITDAVVQRSAIDRLEPEPCDYIISVGFRPGVTDAVGKSALALARDVLARDLGPQAAVYTSRLYCIAGISRDQAHAIASHVLANGLIEQFEVRSRDEFLASAPDRSVPAVRSAHEPTVRSVDLSGSDDDLMQISRTRVLSLSLEEMRAIQAAYQDPSFLQVRQAVGLGPHPTDVELECVAQTWSEHCKHKIFNAVIHYEEPGAPPRELHSLFREHIRATTEQIRRDQEAQHGKSWLVSVFHDNAGVIAFNSRMHVVYKVETHNTPSALDPYGGAMTGIVGVNRDPFGTGLGAQLLANVWGYCFAEPSYRGPIPAGLMHPRRVREGVHHGVIEGGNQAGIPYMRGWELFDQRYLGKPLVFCGTVARMPVQAAGQPSHEKHVRPGDRVVMCGGRIGKDGIHGATFSSEELTEQSPVQAVQIGDPITQKRMFDFLWEARELGLYSAITDNGAGGLSSSVGELCTLSGGAKLDLARAPLKYAGLDPWEILISEAQERMTLAVPPDKLEALLALAQRREVDASDLGEFTDTGYLHVLFNERTAAYLPLGFLHEGVPTMHLRAVWSPPKHAEPRIPSRQDWTDVLEALLRRFNLASRELRCREYDHEVKALSVVKPWVGKEADVPSDASVMLVEHGSREGLVLSEGVNPYYSDIDTRWMTASVIDQAVRKAVGTGARLDHMAGLDNYCWPDPVQSAHTPDGTFKLAQLVRSTEALAEFCRAYGVPCISGKDSMKNDALMGGVKISIPPTLLFSVIAKIDDVTRAVTPEAKMAGSHVYVLGRTRAELGGSELLRHLQEGPGNAVPQVDPVETLPLYRTVEQAIRDELLLSCHSPTLGGLAVAFALVAIGGKLGLQLDLDGAPDLASLLCHEALFSESNGRFVVTVADTKRAVFEERLRGLPAAHVGRVVEQPRLLVRHRGRTVIDAALHALERAWKETFNGT